MKVKESIIGFVVGDALGLPLKFTSRHEHEVTPVFDMQGYKTHDMPPGTWSDSTSLTLATITSILNKKSIKYDDIMNEFCEWFYNGKYTQYNNTFDYGITTATAINKFKKGLAIDKCGGKSERYTNNEALMRILPLAFFKKPQTQKIEYICSLTHNHERSKIACVLYVEIAKSMIKNDLSIEEHVKITSKKVANYYEKSVELINFQRIFNNRFVGGVNSGCDVIETLEAVIYCLDTTTSYKDAVLKAINLGGDANVTASLCGGLAGIFYGLRQIPIDWIEQIPQIDKVISLCENYDEFCESYW